MLNKMPNNGVHVTESTESNYNINEFCVPNFYKDDLQAILVPHGLVVERIAKLAQIIHSEIGDQPLTVLCVLKGSYRFFNALVTELCRLRLTGTHPLIPDFVRVRSYTNDKSTGCVEIIGWDHLVPLKDQNVLIVEDLIDTGLTMQRLVAKLHEEKPQSIRVATLAVKRVAETHDGGYTPEYVGFSLPNEFVVGYGLDYNQKFRDLDHIAVLNKEGIIRHRE